VDAARKPTLIASVQRALHVLEAVADADVPVTAKVVARTVRLAPATTYHLLRTLAHEGYVQRLSDGTWALGERATQLRLPTGYRGAVHRCRPVIDEAAHAIRSPVYVAAWRDGEVEIADVVEPPGTRRIELWVGMRDAVHATALGKAVLASLPHADRSDFVQQHPMAALTPSTITDRGDLLAGLGSVAVDREEYAPGVSCVAVPTRLGGLPAAIGVVVAPRRLDALAGSVAETLGGYAQRMALASAS
jgi:IclR family transcriptional regulator, acetate operon repressor